jgi:ABC-type Fe3+/spermidine/putrescine transport system ATPase subunit
MALEVIGLKKSFGIKNAKSGFSVSLDLFVEKGETLVLVGPSGSGKTTALNLIAGIAEPESGKVIIDGEDMSGLPCWKRNISVVFQDLALFPHLDVGGNIAYGLFIRGVSRKKRQKVIDETLETVRLPGFASRRVDTLSGGERQRVAIARALASSPRALLLDEPFSSLDLPLRRELRREFLEIRRRSSNRSSERSEAPCVFVTHDREEAMMLGDRVALMSGGNIVEAGPGRELFLAPKTQFAAGFFGAGHVLPCDILGTREGGTDTRTPFGNLLVPAGSEYDPLSPKLFIPRDAVYIEEPAGRGGMKSCNAKYEGSFFEGLNITMKIFPKNPEGQSTSAGITPEQFSLEVTAGPRTKLPAPGSSITLWVDQSLLRFVK